MKAAKTILFSTLVATLFLNGCSQLNNKTHTPHTAAQTHETNKKAVWIDVRSEAEFATEHIDGAINIPLKNIAQDIQNLNIPKDTQIHLYCRKGHLSRLAFEELQKQGYTHLIDEGDFESLKQRLINQ